MLRHSCEIVSTKDMNSLSYSLKSWKVSLYVELETDKEQEPNNTTSVK